MSIHLFTPVVKLTTRHRAYAPQLMLLTPMGKRKGTSFVRCISQDKDGALGGADLVAGLQLGGQAAALAVVLVRLV